MNMLRKNGLYVLGFLVLCILAYQFAFSKTIQELKKNRQIENNQSLQQNMELNLTKLKQQDVYYTELLNKHQLNVSGSFQNNLLQFLTSYAKENDLTIVSFKDPHTVELEKAIQETYPIELKGEYLNLLGTLHQLEAVKKFGTINSCNFWTKKNFKTKKKELFCKVSLQRIIQNQN